MMPICVSLMPFAKHASFLGLVMTILGFNMGCIDNVANLAILKLHSNNVSPYIQVNMAYTHTFQRYAYFSVHLLTDNALLLRSGRFLHAHCDQILP
jgi:hypothetical protein